MKKINKLTSEQEARIPEYLNKWVAVASQPLDREKTVKITKELFGEDKTIIVAESIQNSIDVIKFISKGKKIEYNSQLSSQLYSQLSSQLESQLNSPLYSQLRSQLYSQLRSQLDSQLESQLESQLYSQLESQLSSQLDSQLESQLNSPLYSQLRSQLNSQLDSQLYSQLDSQLSSQLYSQLYSQLRSQLDSQLESQLNSPLYSQLRSQLNSQLDSQLYSQLDSQLRSQLYSQLRSQLDSQLESQLESQLNSNIKYARYTTQYWLTWLGFYDYAKMIGVKFDEEKLQRMNEIVTAIPTIISLGQIMIVIENPKCRWEDQMLHNDQFPAIEWKDNTGIYFLDGVNFEKELWQKVISKEMSLSDIMKIEIADQRTVALKYNPQAIIKENAVLVHKDERNNELYLVENSEINEITESPKMWFLKMKCPTGRIFIEGIEPAFAEANQNATECQAELCGLTKSEYMSMKMES